MTGVLYLVPTPIGNLEDITLRALRTLREVSLIACEDTRHTRRLLDHFTIATPTLSCHEHNERERAGLIIDKLQAGLGVALVSDAGTPGVSDPGARVVALALAAGCKVVALPGACAAVVALAASGLATDRFHFVGFIPPKSQARRAALRRLRQIEATLIFHEAPHRIRQFLDDARATLGDRPAVVMREMTKHFEERIGETLAALAVHFETHEPRGEMVVLIAGATEGDAEFQEAERSPMDDIRRLMTEQNVSAGVAVKIVSQARGIPKRDLYKQWLAHVRSDEE
jgi:16S rRNA (cytidine1402-2'-O)-methyltransferase